MDYNGASTTGKRQGVRTHNGGYQVKRVAIAGLLLLALSLGTAIGWVDSRPNWDDTGITIGAVLLASALCGLIGPKLPWLWGIAVGIGVPAWGIALDGSLASLVAFPIAVAGSYLGALVRRVVSRWGSTG
jgi:hypothetical protein